MPLNKPQDVLEIYKEGWHIKTAFKALKSSGFNIEFTHLNQIHRIEKLFVLVLIAFTWAFVAGNYQYQNIKPIKTKCHGEKAKSIFKYGLSILNRFVKCLFSGRYKYFLFFCHVLRKMSIFTSYEKLRKLCQSIRLFY